MKPNSITLVFENCEAIDIDMKDVLFYILDEGAGCTLSERTLNSFAFVFNGNEPVERTSTISSYSSLYTRLVFRDVTWIELVYPDESMIRYYVPWPDGFDYTHPDQTCYRSHFHTLFQQGHLIDDSHLDRIGKYIG